jgi:pectate lyase
VGRPIRWLAALLLLVPRLAWALPAFPGAEGYGSDTPGGRGGDVYVVSDLQGGGPGSLKAALKARGPRIIVFAVSGTYRGRLTIDEPYLTIAGQTAPGGGIAVNGAEGGALEIKTHDVVIRHLRLRSGPPDTPDTLRLGPEAHHVVIDHCSISWGVDENLAVLGHTNTIQWSIISEALQLSTHKAGDHSMGAILGPGNVSVHHTLFAHNRARNPRIGGRNTTVDFVNNVIYNYGSAITRLSASALLELNYVGNTILKGPDSGSAPVFAMARDYPVSIFADANATPASVKLISSRQEHMLASRRHAAPQVTTSPAREALAEVLAHAGASLPRRDPVDARIVWTVLKRKGYLIDHPDQVGGWPDLAPGTAPQDTDQDGMPDRWERERGLDPDDPSDARGDPDGDGYTNIEDFINHHAPWPRRSAAGTEAP